MSAQKKLLPRPTTPKPLRRRPAPPAPKAAAIRLVPRPGTGSKAAASEAPHASWLKKLPKPAAEPAKPIALAKIALRRLPAADPADVELLSPADESGTYAAVTVAEPSAKTAAEPPMEVTSDMPLRLPAPPALPRELNVEALIASVPDDDDELSQLVQDTKRRKRRGMMLALAVPAVIVGLLAFLSKPAVHDSPQRILSKAKDTISGAAYPVIREIMDLEKIKAEMAAEDKAEAEKQAKEAERSKKRRRGRRR